jgi:hypothetical protein
LKEQADRCRSLAEKADQFTKRRLLDLAEKYDDRSGRPSGLPYSRNAIWLGSADATPAGHQRLILR